MKEFTGNKQCRPGHIASVTTKKGSILFYVLFACTSLVCATLPVFSQDTAWTTANKQSLIENYKRTKQAVNDATIHLNASQWAFKESPDTWTIAQVVEHLNMWQLITLYNTKKMVDGGRRPELAPFCATDSMNVLFIYETRAHKSPDYTVPTGFIPGITNLEIFNFNCDKIIGSIQNNNSNFKLFFRGSRETWVENLYQTYAVQYGHVERHMRQINRIMSNKNFPK